MIDFGYTDVFKYLYVGIEPLIPYVVPYVAVFLLGELIYAIIKCASHRVYDFFYFHQSARERKKAHKRIDNVVDFVSNIIDLISTSKSDKR